jgi:hypothetical protein
MEWYWACALLFGSVTGLMLIGLPVAIAFLGVNVLAAMLFMGGTKGIVQVLNNGFGGITSFALVPIPMFLLMGDLFFTTGRSAFLTPPTNSLAMCRHDCLMSRF